MKVFQKAVTSILAMIIAGSVFAGCKTEEKPAGSTEPPAVSKEESAPAESRQEREEVTFTVLFGEHGSMPYQADTWVIPAWAREKFNVRLDLTAIPGTDWGTKMNTVIAGGDVPDILIGCGRDTANEYGSAGLFLNMAPYVEKMPHLQAIWKQLPFIKTHMIFAENEIYASPSQVSTEGAVDVTAKYTTFARKDIMDEIGIKEDPKTFEELHEMLKAMKEKYPESYPWINRGKFKVHANVFAPGLGITMAPGGCSRTGFGVWKEDQKQFTSIFAEENFRWFLGWMNDLFREELIDPGFAVDKTDVWQDKLSTGKGFYSVDYFSRPDSETKLGREIDPNFTLQAMLPPALEGGQRKVLSDVGVVSSNAFSAKCKEPDRLMELVDGWFFSEEGCLVSTNGIEGKTYRKGENNTLEKIFAEGMNDVMAFKSAYGTNYTSFYCFNPDVFGYDLYDKNQTDVYNYTWNLLKDEQIPNPPTIFFSVEEDEEFADFGADLNNTLMSTFNEFIIGRRDAKNDADWATAEKEALEAGYQKHLDLLNEAYARTNP